MDATLINQETILQAISILSNPKVIALLIFIMLWKAVWYGIAIYKAATRKNKWILGILIVCFLFVNDLGLIAMLFLIFERYATKVEQNKKVKSNSRAKSKKK